MHKPEVREVPLNQLVVDLRVQRPLDTRRANKIAAELNLDAIGLICTSHRDDGTYSIIDGQHRTEALRINGFTGELVQCEVYQGLTLADEAAMFRLRNNTAKPQYLDKFRVRIIEGDPEALAVMDILDRYGWALLNQHATGGHRPEGRFAAVQALERAYAADRDSDPTAAERVIATVTAAWGHESDGVDGRLIDGLGRVYLRYGSAINSTEMISRLRKYPGGPGALVGRARGLKELLGVTGSQAFAELFVELYNRQRKTRALPSWRSS